MSTYRKQVTHKAEHIMMWILNLRNHFRNLYIYPVNRCYFAVYHRLELKKGQYVCYIKWPDEESGGTSNQDYM